MSEKLFREVTCDRCPKVIHKEEIDPSDWGAPPPDHEQPEVMMVMNPQGGPEHKVKFHKVCPSCFQRCKAIMDLLERKGKKGKKGEEK